MNIPSTLIQKVKIVPVLNKAGADGTQVSATIDRTGYNSCIVSQSSGIVSGSPDPATWTVAKMVTGTSSSLAASDTTFATLSNPTLDKTGGARAAANDVFDAVDLNGANKYIAICFTLTLTGGTSPKCPCEITIILGDLVIGPTVADAAYPVLP